jgi:hypothetical protein
MIFGTGAARNRPPASSLRPGVEPVRTQEPAPDASQKTTDQEVN